MPRYRLASGVVVDIPAEKAARIDGLTPVDSASPAAPVRRPRKAKPAAAKPEA